MQSQVTSRRIHRHTEYPAAAKFSELQAEEDEDSDAKVPAGQLRALREQKRLAGGIWGPG